MEVENSEGRKINEDLSLLWCCDFYDGPLSGIACFRGRICWFQLGRDSSWASDSRRFELYWLSDDEIAAEQTRHDYFTKFVGYHTDYRYNTPFKHPQKFWDMYYKKYPPKSSPNYTDNEIIGEFWT